ncbi:Hypothetical predicted protein [Cloeon dipterum]|uniref:SCP domain-containing protein n=1 Tax=Cloeon dipterum TaxID=197152 RepID=A0A8S1E4P9_9INSE|nr:Hypothetical predicted protein [Cloeon dipterum]
MREVQRALQIFLLGAGVAVALGAKCADPKYERFSGHAMCLSAGSCTGKNLITSGLKEDHALALLHAINRFRSLVATGSVPGFSPAANMRQLVWDAELAKIAQRWSEQCIMKEDFSRTERFEVGQIMGHEWKTPITEGMNRDPFLLDFLLMVFWNAFDKSYPARHVSEFVPLEANIKLTQLIWAESAYIGCGHTIYGDNVQGHVSQIKSLFCNIGPRGNVEGESVYEEGLPACEVPSGHYEGLCSTKEIEAAYSDPCKRKNFVKAYPALCDDRLFYKWIGHGVPFPYRWCNSGLWKRRFWSAFCVLATLLFSLLVGVGFELSRQFRRQPASA